MPIPPADRRAPTSPSTLHPRAVQALPVVAFGATAASASAIVVASAARSVVLTVVLVVLLATSLAALVAWVLLWSDGRQDAEPGAAPRFDWAAFERQFWSHVRASSEGADA